MKRTIEVNVSQVILKYELESKETEVLRLLKKNGYIEFRDKNETDSSGKYVISDLDELIENDFLMSDLDSWHTTYVLTDLGKVYVKELE